MKTTFTVVAGISTFLSTFTSCVKEELPPLSDAPALPEGTITLDKAKAYFSQNSTGTVAALNREHLHLHNPGLSALTTDTSAAFTKSYTTSSIQTILPQWERSITVTNPKFSTLRVPLSGNTSGITRIGSKNEENKIEYRNANVESYLIVQKMYKDDRMRQYVETVIKSDESLTTDSYVLITDITGEYLWCNRWKNGRQTDMALLANIVSDVQNQSLNGILQRSMLDSFVELPGVEVTGPSQNHDCYRCGQYPCQCCTRCFQYPCVCWVCPLCGRPYCDGKMCQQQPEKPNPNPGANPNTPESPGFPLINIVMDTVTQKKLNKILKQINEDCMGQKLLGALNSNYRKKLTIKFNTDIMVTTNANGFYSHENHSITIGLESLSTLTEELFHAYQGANLSIPYTTTASLNYEVEAKIAKAQINERTDQISKQSQTDMAMDEMFLNYYKEPSESQYNHIVWVLRKIGYTPDKFPDSPAHRDMSTLRDLSQDCDKN